MEIELEFRIRRTQCEPGCPDWEKPGWAVSFPWSDRTPGLGPEYMHEAYKSTLDEVTAYLEYVLPARYYNAIVKRVK